MIFLANNSKHLTKIEATSRSTCAMHITWFDPTLAFCSLFTTCT